MILGGGRRKRKKPKRIVMQQKRGKAKPSGSPSTGRGKETSKAKNSKERGEEYLGAWQRGKGPDWRDFR